MAGKPEQHGQIMLVGVAGLVDCVSRSYPGSKEDCTLAVNFGLTAGRENGPLETSLFAMKYEYYISPIGGIGEGFLYLARSMIKVQREGTRTLMARFVVSYAECKLCNCQSPQ